MRIASLYYTHKPGGFCRRLYRLLNALAERGHEVIFYTLDPVPAGSLDGRVVVEYLPFSSRRRSGVFFWLSYALKMAVHAVRVSRSQRAPERWAIFNPFYAALVSPAAALSDAPIILFVRSKLAPNASFFLAQWVERLTNRVALRVARRVVVQTKANLELALELGAKDQSCEILPNDTPEVSSTAPSTKPLKVLTTGVFNARKNLAVVVTAWQLLGESNAELTVAGTGPDFVTQRESNRGSLSPVNFVDWKDDVAPLLQASNVLVHPSRHEGMPNSVLEALSAGLITILADVPELRELLPNPELRFPPDDAEALASILRRLSSDLGFRARSHDYCRQRAKELHFPWDAEASRIVTSAL